LITFSPLSVSPVKFGADIVIHSLTKYINGSSDTGGVTCASHDFINELKDVNSGASMLLGPTMDSMRSASVMKTYVHFILESSSTVIMRFTLQNILKRRNKTVYPGLKSHPSHDLYAGMINSEYGFME
jgi:methionine-gamma-lyase